MSYSPDRHLLIALVFLFIQAIRAFGKRWGNHSSFKFKVGLVDRSGPGSIKRGLTSSKICRILSGYNRGQDPPSTPHLPDQSLIISGETGSGKSETRHLAIKTLLELYRYLGHRAGTGTRANGVRDDDANRFEQLKSQDGSQLVAAILHLGNIEFIIDRGRDVDAAVVRNVDVFGIVAEFLGVQPSALETTLAYKTKLTLYTLLFAWLNEHVNQRLCRDDFDAFIGLFDLPGPQNMTSRPNSLDKFCIKFANERLQNFIQKCIFESHVDEYQTEGISRFIPSVPYFDNAECARRSHKKTDLTMVEAFGKRWGNHSSFKVGPVDQSGSPTFTVNHFNGPVSYSSIASSSVPSIS
ncbi:P-loop containing nucleoside triphosphate hydrolase protein [Boletus edulis BED1]|uniref:P-loop containing nucleoside triphosphate hydrolase protein n=1 Tax=Boletus edulis BED1 TaxID=1328754 RepID=A0AAD4BCR7_BOLED|nr:P-loop containing nucleoside triphosphate hydrolase protein [Boletus edulis BED1]